VVKHLANMHNRQHRGKKEKEKKKNYLMIRNHKMNRNEKIAITIHIYMCTYTHTYVTCVRHICVSVKFSPFVVTVYRNTHPTGRQLYSILPDDKLIFHLCEHPITIFSGHL
jgi:hypothetical protein